MIGGLGGKAAAAAARLAAARLVARARTLGRDVGASLKFAASWQAREPAGTGAPETAPPVRRRGVPRARADAVYRAPPSFVDHLPWAEALPGGAILLEDGRSVGAVWEAVPVGTEGRDADWLGDVRDGLEAVLQETFDELDAAQWVVQTFAWREPDLGGAVEAFADYVREEHRDTAYTRAYAALLERHYRLVARPGGLFHDALSQTAWGAGRQRTFLVVYRWAGRRETGDAAAFEGALEDACGKLVRGLRGVGIGARRVAGAEFHGWMTRWFNAFTALTPDDPVAFARRFRDGDGIPAGDGFAESMLYAHPRSDADRGTWSFDATTARVLAVEGFAKAPQVGHVTGEIVRGDAVNAVLDQLPEGTVYATAMVAVPQDAVDGHVDRIAAAASGEGAQAARARADCGEAKRIMGERHKLYRFAAAFYLRAPSAAELERRTGAAWTVLLQHRFRVVAPRDDVRALDNYLAYLPMAYEPDADRRMGWRRARLAWVQHVADLWPVFGRSTGTGHPGLSFWNRGGEVLSFDPWNRLDRSVNAHGLLVGPSGSGKSATLGAMLAQAMAVHRPRLFLVEAGNSFGLLVDWFESLGLSVRRVSLKPGEAVSLAPFADAKLLPEVSGIREPGDDAAPLPDATDLGPLADPTPGFGGGAEEGAPTGAGADAEVRDEDEEEARDVLGELETVATLMVTEGREREADLLRPAERRAIRDAVIAAGRRARREGRDTLTEDVAEAFHAASRERAELPPESRMRLVDMGDAVRNFCDEGFLAQVFNRGGETWPEADVTLVDVGTFARDGYSAHLAVAVISLMNVVNNIAERDQRTGRDIVVAIDEAHMVTTHPLLSPYLVRIVKMWRKLGAWLWLATQNLEDFPGEARRLLNTIEWWILLVMPPDEVEQVARFRSVSASQRQLLASASKAAMQYTEGVVLAPGIETLFRVVPPSLVLALVQTEQAEKARREAIRRETGCTEVEAAVRVAEEIDEGRGARR